MIRVRDRSSRGSEVAGISRLDIILLANIGLGCAGNAFFLDIKTEMSSIEILDVLNFM